jgi:hypothetical protein
MGQRKERLLARGPDAGSNYTTSGRWGELRSLHYSGHWFKRWPGQSMIDGKSVWMEGINVPDKADVPGSTRRGRRYHRRALMAAGVRAKTARGLTTRGRYGVGGA